MRVRMRWEGYGEEVCPCYIQDLVALWVSDSIQTLPVFVYWELQLFPLEFIPSCMRREREKRAFLVVIAKNMQGSTSLSTVVQLNGDSLSQCLTKSWARTEFSTRNKTSPFFWDCWLDWLQFNPRRRNSRQVKAQPAINCLKPFYGRIQVLD
jgi:hypothetical protein